MYQNVLFLDDFNAPRNGKCMDEFCNLNGLTSLIKKPTCFKNADKPTCKQPNFFQHSNVFETRLTDFHLLIVTEFKMGFQKQLQYF